MYVLAAVLVLSRLFARSWIGNLHAERACKQATAEIGESIPVRLRVRNSGMFLVPWVLLEDLLPASALKQRPPRLEVDGKRLQIRMIRGGQEITFRYELCCQMRGYYQIGPLVMDSTSDLRTSLPEMKTGFSSLCFSIKSTRPADS